MSLGVFTSLANALAVIGKPGARLLDDTGLNFPEVLAFMRRERGVRYLLCEGGPTLNGSLARADLIDERFVTVSPVEIGLQIPAEQELSETERAMPREPD